MRTNRLMPYFFVAPSLLIVSIFIYYPVVDNIQSSFFSWNSFSPDREFLGFNNYTRIFSDEVFLISLKNNFIHAGVSLLIQVGGGLVIAAILEDPLFRRFAPFLRTMYFLPVLISITVIGLLFSFIYNPQIGLLNHFLTFIGLEHWTTGCVGQ